MLAERLSSVIPPDGLVLAVPAGGVPVALEIGNRLNLVLDLMIVRKVQIPGNPEAGFGAVGPDGEVIFNQDLLSRLRLTQDEINKEVGKTRKIVEGRNLMFRGGKNFPEVTGRTIILVDDGLASGFTMTEAVRFMERNKPGKVLVAVPTAPEETVKRIAPLVDEMHVLNVRTGFPFAVAEAYENWYDLTDEEVISLLANCGNEIR